MNLPAALRSPKTTTLGFIALVIAAALALTALMDGDPETMPNWDEVYLAILGLIGLVSRDGDKSSQDVGIRPKLIAMPWLLCVAVGLGGCATDPSVRYAQASSGVNAARALVATAYNTGEMEPDEVIALDAAEKAVRFALDVVRDKLSDPDANPATLDFYLDLAEQVLGQFERLSPSGDISHAPRRNPFIDPSRSHHDEVRQRADRLGEEIGLAYSGRAGVGRCGPRSLAA